MTEKKSTVSKIKGRILDSITLKAIKKPIIKTYLRVTIHLF
jgi:hypothetical protein